MFVRKSGRRREFVITLFAMGLLFTFGYYCGHVVLRYNLLGTSKEFFRPGRVNAMPGTPETPRRWAPLSGPTRSANPSSAAHETVSTPSRLQLSHYETQRGTAKTASPRCLLEVGRRFR